MCAGEAATVLLPLHWSEVPRGTASFALVVHDLEPRPRNGIDDILHWMIWNIAASTTQFSVGLPVAAELSDGSRQSTGDSAHNAKPLYQGPCAQPGFLRQYTFELFALDQMLDRTPGATRADLLKAMDGHIVGHAVLTGRFDSDQILLPGH